MHKLPRPTVSGLIAVLALFVAQAGAAYAATSLPRESVGTAQIKDGSITAAKLADSAANSLRGPRGARGLTGATGATGATGDRGPQGEKGASAEVDSQLRATIVKQSEEIEALTSHLSNLTTKNETLETSLGTVKTTADTAGKGVTEAEERVDQFVAGLGNLESEVGGVEASVTDFGSKITELQNDLGNVEGTVGGIGTTLTNTVKGLVNLEGSIGSTEEVTATANKKAGEATSGLATLTTKVSGQCNALDESVKVLNQLNDATTELTSALNLVLGGFLPKLPENAKGASC